MRQTIVVTDDLRDKIMEVFKVTRRTIWNALNYDPKWGYTDKAKRIRQMAFRNGATVQYEVSGDEVFFDSAGNLRQVLPDGIEIIVEKRTGTGKIMRYGKTVEMWADVHVSDLEAMQERAKSING